MFGFKTTVDSILSAHNKTVTKLERHALKTDNKATDLDAQIEKLADKRDAHLKESRRAINTAVKLRQLID